MTLAQVLGQLAAGLRLALTLLAVMSLLTHTRWVPEAETDACRLAARRLNAGAWAMLAWGVVIYSPAHAGWLLGHPTSQVVNRALDAIACALACAAWIKVLAYRGLMRGLSGHRVRRGMRVNVGIVIAVIGAAWLTR